MKPILPLSIEQKMIVLRICASRRTFQAERQIGMSTIRASFSNVDVRQTNRLAVVQYAIF